VKTGRGRFIEIQGTAESTPFDEEGLSRLLRAAGEGIEQIIRGQEEAIGALDLLRPRE